jgi:hypothetical protein
VSSNLGLKFWMPLCPTIGGRKIKKFLKGKEQQQQHNHPFTVHYPLTSMSSTDEFGRTLMEGEAGAHVSSAAQSGQDRWKHDRMQAPPSVGSTEIVTLGGKVFEDAAALW